MKQLEGDLDRKPGEDNSSSIEFLSGSVVALVFTSICI